MSSQSSYHSGPSHSFYSSHASTSPSNSGQMYSARDMLPPTNMDFPPLRPMDIEVNNNSILNSSRTLPNPSASAPAAWGDSGLFGSHSLETQFGSSNILRSHQPAEPSARASQPNPLVQWYSANDGPWIPQEIKDAGPDERSNSRQAGIRMPQLYGHHYRSSNHMDGGSFHYSVPQSDSGYGTRHSVGTTSVFSGDVNERDQDNQSLLGPSPDYHPYPGYNESLQMQSHEGRTSDPWSTPGSGLSPLPSSGLTCPICLKPVKTPSELKKHDLRHTKPFICTVHGCKRIGGFSTSNDLERHNKSKHPTLAEVALTKRFRCPVPGCKSKDKSWPRLDNFRSHLKRVHGNCIITEEDTEQTIRRGEYVDASRNIEQDDQPQDIQSDYTHMEKPAAAEVVSRQGNAWRNPEDLRPSHGSIPSIGSVLEIPFHKSHHRQERSPLPEPSRQETVKPVEVFPLQVTNMSTSALPLHRDILNITGLIDPSLTNLDARVSKDTGTDGKAEKGKEISADPAIVEVVKTALAAVSKAQEEASQNQAMVLDNLPNGRIKDPNPGLCSTAEIHIPDDRSGFSSSELDINDPEARKNAQVLEVLNVFTKLGFTLKKDPSHTAKLPEAQTIITTASKSDKKVICPTCKGFTGRPCELKKHMKRHSKPYGCTFANCTKIFGSKNDWKRHENSQHLHQEILRCNISREEENGVCGKAFYRRQTFQEHLKNSHHMEDDISIKEKMESCRIGRNGQSRFWCGFCVTTVDLKKKGTDAWNERFDHIDNHFMGRIDGRIVDDKALNIRDWMYVNSDKPRGDIDSPPSSKEGSDHETTSPEASGCTPAEAIVLDPVDKGQTLKRKHSSEADEEESRPSKIKKQINRICCQCGSSNNPRFDSQCNTCDRSHNFCEACEFEVECAPLITEES